MIKFKPEPNKYYKVSTTEHKIHEYVYWILQVLPDFSVEIIHAGHNTATRPYIVESCDVYYGCTWEELADNTVNIIKALYT